MNMSLTLDMHVVYIAAAWSTECKQHSASLLLLDSCGLGVSGAVPGTLEPILLQAK